MLQGVHLKQWITNSNRRNLFHVHLSKTMLSDLAYNKEMYECIRVTVNFLLWESLAGKGSQKFKKQCI